MSTTSSTTTRRSTGTTIGLIVLAAFIAAFPMFFNFGDPDSEEQFTGTDDGAESIVEQVNPDYVPWAEPLVGELPGEIESGLFALQAGLGAGLVGFALGNYRGRSKAEKQLTAGASTATTATGGANRD
ncbi:energy-coupling factor ABC transporter substrate-binding protein [Corynebacterium mendelii]|uniref:Cobalt transport protein CbiN n=1 Tax=Corynebacterium mendelii TaxID=2765362 RepID=A0A939E128_9CORY|nr:energy-coupling factor ABC transporter substrate-binding protein [Corynebacterium mendelii]MBN9645009.1 energy-coupling factor ABC transporter substrate-binding protein [Corynebacterium mendelii]